MIHNTREFIVGSVTLACLLLPALNSSASAAQDERCARFVVSKDEGRITNSCERAIIVTWRDDGPCHIECRARLEPSERQAVVRPQGDYSWDSCAIERGRSRCSVPLRSASR